MVIEHYDLLIFLIKKTKLNIEKKKKNLILL